MVVDLIPDVIIYNERRSVWISPSSIQIVGMALEMCRVNKGLKDSIDILKTMRDPKTLKTTRRTPYESVPKSFAGAEIPQPSA